MPIPMPVPQIRIPLETRFWATALPTSIGLLPHLLVRFHHLDAAGLAASAGVNLRLDDEHRRAELARGLDRPLDRKGGVPARHRDAEFPQHRFGLILVDVHADLLPALDTMQHLNRVIPGKLDCAAARHPQELARDMST